MLLLEPTDRFLGATPGLHQIIDVLSEAWIRQDPLDPIA